LPLILTPSAHYDPSHTPQNLINIVSVECEIGLKQVIILTVPSGEKLKRLEATFINVA